MSFLKKTWLARLGVGLNRFRMNNSTDVVLESNPISVTQQGDQLSADNMNNLETRIDNAFTEMAGNLATIEVSPSQHNWTVGSQIVYNGILYKVTSAISTDDNLVVGTNISPYPVSSAISDISDDINAISSSFPLCLKDFSNASPTADYLTGFGDNGYYSVTTSRGCPTDYGVLISIKAYYVIQFFFNYTGSQLWSRGYNTAEGWSNWTQIK